MISIFQDITIQTPIKYILENKKYLLKAGIKIYLENNSNANILLYNYNKTNYFYLNNINNTLENLEENLYLEPDKDAVIYLFYKNNKESNLNFTIFKKEYIDNKVLIFRRCYGCEIYFGYSFNEKYISRIFKLEDILKTEYFIIDNPYNNISLINLEFYIYHSNLNYNFYKSINMNYGYNLLKSNESYSSQMIPNNNITNNYFYYQYISCKESNNQELYLYINDGQFKFQLGYTYGDFAFYYDIKIKSVSFTYNIEHISILNFCFTNNSYKIKTNYNRDFNIYFNSEMK